MLLWKCSSKTYPIPKHEYDERNDFFIHCTALSHSAFNNFVLLKYLFSFHFFHFLSLFLLLSLSLSCALLSIFTFQSDSRVFKIGFQAWIWIIAINILEIFSLCNSMSVSFWFPRESHHFHHVFFFVFICWLYHFELTIFFSPLHWNIFHTIYQTPTEQLFYETDHFDNSHIGCDTYTHTHRVIHACDIIIILQRKKNGTTFKIEFIKMHSIYSFSKWKIIYAGWFDSWSLFLIDACIHISHSINIQDTICFLALFLRVSLVSFAPTLFCFGIAFVILISGKSFIEDFSQSNYKTLCQVCRCFFFYLYIFSSPSVGFFIRFCCVLVCLLLKSEKP